jgi:hypothetical protein
MGGADCAGEDIFHVRAIALKIGAALNTAMPVATQYLASHPSHSEWDVVSFLTWSESS